MSHARPLRSEAEPAVIDGVTVSGPRSAAVETVLTPEALAFGAYFYLPKLESEPVTAARVRSVFAEELEAIRARIGDERFAAGRFATAARLLAGLVTAPELEDFLTLSPTSTSSAPPTTVARATNHDAHTTAATLPTDTRPLARHRP